jgi:hypothetical protein
MIYNERHTYIINIYNLNTFLLTLYYESIQQQNMNGVQVRQGRSEARSLSLSLTHTHTHTHTHIIFGTPAEIRIGHLPNTSQKSYRLSRVDYVELCKRKSCIKMRPTAKVYSVN